MGAHAHAAVVRVTSESLGHSVEMATGPLWVYEMRPERHLGDAPHLDMGCVVGDAPPKEGCSIGGVELLRGRSQMERQSFHQNPACRPGLAFADRGRNEPHGDGSSEEFQGSAARTVARELHRCAEPPSG